MENSPNENDSFYLGYLCGWVQGWGWASAPWIAERVKKLVYLRRANEALSAFDGSEPEDLLQQWEALLLEEAAMDIRFGGKEAEDVDCQGDR